MKKAEWILCPICKNKTRIKVREDTQIKKLPLVLPQVEKGKFNRSQ